MFDRTSDHFVAQWWWTVDRTMLIALGVILALGMVLVMASSPAVAENLGLPSLYFVKRQVVFMLIGITVMFGVSLMTPIQVRRFAAIGFLFSLLLLLCVLVFGVEIKGATRWIRILNFTIQPSEFLKPFFVVITAWILTRGKMEEGFKGYRIALALFVIVAALLFLQPDIGMTMMIALVWGAQLFLAGLPMLWVGGIILAGIVGLTSAYFIFPHVANRINSFFDPTYGENYQTQKSLEAFVSGGFIGQGPGEGVVKDILPDSHTDFIFAVAGEELGIVFTLAIVAVFAFIVIRGFMTTFKQSDLFIVLATSGLILQFALQALINMGVALNLLPNTGVTLPFISYGGSSMVSVSITMGMVLALTRRRFGSDR